MRQNGKNSANIKRTNLRPQVLSGKSKNTGRPFDDAWLKEKWPELLDAHYQCLVPGQSACLQDALRMITTGKVFITCLGAKKEKEQEPRTLSQLEVQVIKEWYDAKDQKLVGSCSGEASSRAQAAAQKRKWLRSGASKAKGKSKGRAKGKANVGSIRSRNCKNSSSSPATPDRAPLSIALDHARPFAAKEAAETAEAKRLRAELQRTVIEKAQLGLKVEALEEALQEAKRQRLDAENRRVAAEEAASDKERLHVEAEARRVVAEDLLRHLEAEAEQLRLAEGANEAAAQQAAEEAAEDQARLRRQIEDLERAVWEAERLRVAEEARRMAAEETLRLHLGKTCGKDAKQPRGNKEGRKPGTKTPVRQHLQPLRRLAEEAVYFAKTDFHGLKACVEERGFGILRGLIPAKQIQAMITKIQEQVALLARLYEMERIEKTGVGDKHRSFGNTCGDTCGELMRLKDRLHSAPKGWVDPQRPDWRISFGSVKYRGWMQHLGAGRMFEGRDFAEDGQASALQELCRPVVAFLHGVPEGALRRVDERVSVKPAGTPMLESHIDGNRRGSYQVVMALSETPFLVFPYSHKAAAIFPENINKYYALTKDELNRLKDEFQSEATEVPAKPGDVLVFEGGSFVHGSVEIKMGQPTRYVAYAQFWPPTK